MIPCDVVIIDGAVGREIDPVRKKVVTPYLPTPAEKSAALADVAYEIEQILDLTFNWPQQKGLQMNAWLEATLIHGRQLLDFFEHSKRSTLKGREHDDVLAVDFGFAVQKVSIGSVFRERLNKDLAHLSYSRQKRTSTTKPWNLNELGPLLERSREFANHIVKNWTGTILPAEAQRWESLKQRLINL